MAGHQGQGLEALTPCKNKKNESGEWVLHAINYKKYIKNNFLDGKCAFFLYKTRGCGRLSIFLTTVGVSL